jgi:tetratricopeptide (TPR) repeat protein
MHGSTISETLRRYHQAQDHLRHGLCLLNAGAHDAAAREFGAAAEVNPTHAALPRFLAACWRGPTAADPATAESEKSPAAAADVDTASRIRQALALWKSGQTSAAIAALRAALRTDPECAELHFQLGTLLAAIDEHEEAELRFTQALHLAPEHADALVGLALYRALRAEAQDAVTYLVRAQRARPHDAHIGLLLSHALKCAAQQGLYCPVLTAMPDHDPAADEAAVEELSQLIEADPDFADALLALPGDQDDPAVRDLFIMLAATLQRALARQPEHADLHYHCGRVLERLGRPVEAIAETERAIALNPRFVQALIQLARLYQQTDRLADATARLEEALAQGGEFADVYYLLGNLYRRAGQIQRARTAYARALRINERYEVARAALEALPG